MSHDDARGVISLKDGIFDITWNKIGNESNFFQVNRRMRKMTKGLGGTFLPNPKWAKPQKRSVITGHPLGGCSMGESGKTAVVNHAGQVFDGMCRIRDLRKFTLFLLTSLPYTLPYLGRTHAPHLSKIAHAQT